MTLTEMPPNPLEKPGYMLEFQDEFEGDTLDLANWIPYYLPQWSSRERSKTRYHFEESMLVLEIGADHAPWCPEFDGEVRCSSLQTGLFAGPVGSPFGQHRFNKACLVREAQPTQRTYTPQYGYFETRVKGVASAKNLVALWMIGFEEVPEESGEIAMFELFGDQMTGTTSEVRYGVHPWSDATLTDEFYRDVLPMDATQFHIYAVEWTPTHIDFYVDNIKRRTIQQSPAYPMQFMLNIYELPREDSPGAVYPKQFVIDYFRGYQPVGGYKSLNPYEATLADEK
jgi:hypothetical protein